jgi:sugar O-acyltransferase (sialic acid O-acetyltransferase NeuD family)
MKKDLLIFPYNGNALEAISCIGEQFNLIGCVDDTIEKQGLQANGINVFSRKAFEKYPHALVLAVPGGPLSFSKREEIIISLKLSVERFAKVIHPNAFVSSMATIGYNVLLMSGVVLTSNCVIGNHVCILPNSVIHHDSIIGHHTLIGSNVTIAGYTKVGENCYVGSGCNIINGIEIGSGALIGMGANVIKSVPKNSKSVGNPAYIL